MHVAESANKVMCDNFAATTCFKVGKNNREKIQTLTGHKTHIAVTASIIAKDHLNAS